MVLAAGAVVFAIAIAAVATYFLVRDQLRSQVDSTLQERAGEANALVEDFARRRGQGLLRELRETGIQLDFGEPDLGLGRLGIPGFATPRAALPGDEEPLPPDGPGAPDRGSEQDADRAQFGESEEDRRRPPRLFGGPFGGLQVSGQLVDAGGEVLALDDSFPSLPVTEQTRAIAAGGEGEAFSDATVDGSRSGS